VAHRCRQLASRLPDQRSAVCAAAIVLASRYTDRDVDTTTGNLDWLGGALATAASGHATWALIEGFRSSPVAYHVRRPRNGLDLLAPVPVCGATAGRQGYDTAFVVRVPELRRPHAFGVGIVDTPVKTLGVEAERKTRVGRAKLDGQYELIYETGMKGGMVCASPCGLPSGAARASDWLRFYSTRSCPAWMASKSG
jgi:hypothetical protein